VKIARQSVGIGTTKQRVPDYCIKHQVADRAATAVGIATLNALAELCWRRRPYPGAVQPWRGRRRASRWLTRPSASCPTPILRAAPTSRVPSAAEPQPAGLGEGIRAKAVGSVGAAGACPDQQDDPPDNRDQPDEPPPTAAIDVMQAPHKSREPRDDKGQVDKTENLVLQPKHHNIKNSSRELYEYGKQHKEPIFGSGSSPAEFEIIFQTDFNGLHECPWSLEFHNF
jgi:hypothetical protein